ncbi:hypothetical protein [Agrobacterium radiobacter]|uniref:hypothetical protein n=1 Tax=Agrobacterium radiobacter TaxID=362 RepID=UPI003CE47C03
MTKLAMCLDVGCANELLSALSDATERFPELRDGFVDLLETGEQLFLLHADGAAAATTGEIVVGLDPSDRLLSLVFAFRARQPKCLLFEHLLPQIGFRDSTTTFGVAQ